MGVYTKIALFVSLFVLIGFPMIFIIISMFTDQWMYFMSSLIPSFSAGSVGLMMVWQQFKKEREEA